MHFMHTYKINTIMYVNACICMYKCILNSLDIKHHVIYVHTSVSYVSSLVYIYMICRIIHIHICSYFAYVQGIKGSTEKMEAFVSHSFEGESAHGSEGSRLQIKQQLLVRKLLKTQ